MYRDYSALVSSLGHCQVLWGPCRRSTCSARGPLYGTSLKVDREEMCLTWTQQAWEKLPVSLVRNKMRRVVGSRQLAMHLILWPMHPGESSHPRWRRGWKLAPKYPRGTILPPLDSQSFPITAASQSASQPGNTPEHLRHPPPH